MTSTNTNQITSNHQTLPIDSFIDAIDRGIYGTDAIGLCNLINQAALKMLGYAREDCIGKNMHELIHSRFQDGSFYPQSECLICKTKNNLTIQDPKENEVFWRSDGSSFYIRYSSNAIYENDIFKGTVVTFSDITEQRNREAAIIESEKKYKYIFDNNPSPMFIWDFETLQIIDCNIEATLKYGYSRAEFLQLNIRDVRPKEDINLINAATLTEEAYGSIHKRVWRHVKKNGELMYAEVTGHLINVNGRKCSLVLINDITEQNKAEYELKTSEEKLRVATEIARLGYWQKDVDGKNRYWSDELYKIWGVPKDSFTLSFESFFQTIHPDDRQHFETEQAASLLGTGNVDFEYRIVLPDGTVKWLHEIGTTVMDKDGNPATIRGTVQDITAQKLLSLSLEERNMQYSFVTKATSDAIWDWDLVSNTLYLGEGFEAMFGHQATLLKPTMAFGTDFIHPDDQDRVVHALYAVINGTDTNWKDEYRYRKADDTFAYVVNRGFVIRNSDGNATRMVGAMYDITQRKREEQRLKLLESVVTNTNDAILITEAESLNEPGLRIIYVNDAFTRMTGYAASEVIGKSPRILQGPDSDQKELKRLSSSLRQLEPCELTTVNYKKNGEAFWVNFSVSPVADQNGLVTHWVAIQRDVTERKIAEEERQLFTDELFKRNKELQQFGYVISHNLRSPIANILGIANLLELDKDDPETIDHCARSLKIATGNLDSVVKDLSKILSITDDSAELMKEQVDLRELIENVTVDLKPVIEHTGAVVEVSVEPILISLHKAYLYSIFHNLISNAIKYRSEKLPLIRISALVESRTISIKVCDNGIGIDLVKYNDQLFKPYKRFNNSVEGKGLGLFLVKSHVDALSGNLSVESELGIGTTFNIHLPLS